MSSADPARHPIRDGLVAAAITAAEVTATAQGSLPQVFPTPTTQAGQPLITQDERDWADYKRKQDQDRLFDFEHPVAAPEQVEQRPRDSQPER